MGTEGFLEGVRRVQSGDRQAEEALLRENMPLVAAIARRYQNCGLGQEDMLQLGSIGLLQALRRLVSGWVLWRLASEKARPGRRRASF